MKVSVIVPIYNVERYIARCVKSLMEQTLQEVGVSGMNAEPGNAQDLARAIEAVTENEEVYRKFSEGATKRYRDMFTKECMIDKCLTIYLEL